MMQPYIPLNVDLPFTAEESANICDVKFSPIWNPYDSTINAYSFIDYSIVDNLYSEVVSKLHPPSFFGKEEIEIFGKTIKSPPIRRINYLMNRKDKISEEKGFPRSYRKRRNKISKARSSYKISRRTKSHQ